MTDLDMTQIHPYADALGDGLINLNFTLPVPFSPAANRAAEQLARSMGLESPEVVHSMALTQGFTYFVLYATCPHSVDFQLASELSHEQEHLRKEEIETALRDTFARPLVVVGASTGTDTHSVGIDAMLNLKGFDGEKGLEAYQGIEVHNLGSQVPNSTLIAKAIEVKADAILVSQTVTQQQLHIHNLTQLVDMLEAEQIRHEVLLICGGPRVTNELAKELGFDAGFSKGCYPNHLATFIVRELTRRQADHNRLEPVA